MADICVIGGCIIDLISYASRFPKPGETLAGTEFRKGFGGKAANQCVMADRLGASVALIAKLGNDTFGLEYLESMKKSSVITDFLTCSNDASTSTASILVTDEGQNSIVYVPGAIMKLTHFDIEDAKDLISKSRVLLCTYECPLATLFSALTIAKKNSVLTVVNAAPAADSSYEALYPLIDIICLNEVEAEMATGISIQSPADAIVAIALLMERKCSTVIITLGEKGAIFKMKGSTEFVRILADCVTPIDSTGAGDAFMGSLVYFLAKVPALSMKEMVEKSCSIATMSVLKHGTQTSFPYPQDLLNYLES